MVPFGWLSDRLPALTAACFGRYRKAPDNQCMPPRDLPDLYYLSSTLLCWLYSAAYKLSLLSCRWRLRTTESWPRGTADQGNAWLGMEARDVAVHNTHHPDRWHDQASACADTRSILDSKLNQKPRVAGWNPSPPWIIQAVQATSSAGISTTTKPNETAKKRREKGGQCLKLGTCSQGSERHQEAVQKCQPTPVRWWCEQWRCDKTEKPSPRRLCRSLLSPTHPPPSKFEMLKNWAPRPTSTPQVRPTLSLWRRPHSSARASIGPDPTAPELQPPALHSSEPLKAAPAPHSSEALKAAPALHSSEALKAAPALHSSEPLKAAPALHSSEPLKAAPALHSSEPLKAAPALQRPQRPQLLEDPRRAGEQLPLPAPLPRRQQHRDVDLDRRLAHARLAALLDLHHGAADDEGHVGGRRLLEADEDGGGEGERGRREAGAVHQGDRGGPVAVAVDERRDDPAVDDAWWVGVVFGGGGRGGGWGWRRHGGVLRCVVQGGFTAGLSCSLQTIYLPSWWSIHPSHTPKHTPIHPPTHPSTHPSTRTPGNAQYRSSRVTLASSPFFIRKLRSFKPPSADGPQPQQVLCGV